MINKVFKYDVEIKDNQTIYLPVGSRFLRIGNKIGNSVMSIWAMVNSREPLKIPLDLVVLGTGNVTEIDLDMFVHLDTVIMNSQLVWHVYANKKQLKEFL